MNFIYDITLNLKKDFYNFYEWKEDDHPDFILKIPIFKIDNEAFLDIKNNNIKISSKILNMIKNQTEIYSPNSVKIKKYSCLFSCEEEVIGVEFNENGNNINKSSLSIDEENEVIDMTTFIKCTCIDYKVCNKLKNKYSFKTRKEKEIIDYLEKELNKIIKNNNYEELKYIFYEIYNEKIDNIDKMYIKLLNIIKNCDKKSYKIYELINIINNKKITN